MQIERRVIFDVTERETLVDAVLHIPLRAPPDVLRGWVPTAPADNWAYAVVRVLRGDSRSPKGRLFRDAGMGSEDIEALCAAFAEGQAHLEKCPQLFSSLEQHTRRALDSGLRVVLTARASAA